ncbi:MAG: LLM class flavin-dependent oxidoreductase [Chloroflexota bacterium]|nr:LLM class flavin-dependent oxidoreductase [Chloroflexota bacterium]
MHPLQFGFCVPIFAFPGGRLFRTPNYAELDTAKTMQMAHTADALGYDSLWVADHLMLGKDSAILEGWTVLAALAGSTQQAKLGMIHQGHFFRHPALVAKMTATLDQISGGRFIYFIDAGYGQHEHLAYGLPYPETMEERMSQVVAGLELTLALWGARTPISMTGQYHQVTGAVCNPPPLQQPHPPVWFGEAHPAILAACARYGQGWNTVPVGVVEVRRRLQALTSACAAVGRSSDELEKSLEIQILIAPDRATLRTRLQTMIALVPPDQPDALAQAFLRGETDTLPPAWTDNWLIGTPDEVEAQMRVYIELGITHFLLWFMDAPHEDGLRLFAQGVMGRFR